MKVYCPHCGAMYELEPEHVGRKAECGECKQTFVVQAVAKTAPAAAHKHAHAGKGGRQIDCPHCWNRFSLEDVKYIAEHSMLRGDDILGEDEMQRFTPSNFTVEGLALDAKGMPCADRACPRCHLRLPLSLLSLDSLYFSLVGAPSSGKSYLLSSMVAMLRRDLPGNFATYFSDADARINTTLNDYEGKLFRNASPNEITALPKTELRGESFSHQVLIDGMVFDLPSPFVFSLKPAEHHPAAATGAGDSLRRNLILYDNAGEHFQPGAESSANPATRHLVKSQGVIFLFDPSSDARMRVFCNPDDPQIKHIEKVTGQHSLLTEMVNRVQRHGGLKPGAKYDYPLVVCVGKLDMWEDLLHDDLRSVSPWRLNKESMTCELDMDVIMKVSFDVREILLKIAPEIVNISEDFSKRVFFVPVSAFGGPPVEFQAGAVTALGVRPSSVEPIWASVPALLLLAERGYLGSSRGNYEPESGGVHEVKDYREINGKVVFALPGRDMPMALPVAYKGVLLHNAAANEWFKVGDQEGAGDMAVAAAGDDDDAFWK